MECIIRLRKAVSVHCALCSGSMGCECCDVDSCTDSQLMFLVLWNFILCAVV
jgi:hypothetical protein